MQEKTYGIGSYRGQQIPELPENIYQAPSCSSVRVGGIELYCYFDLYRFCQTIGLKCLVDLLVYMMDSMCYPVLHLIHI